MRHDTPDSIVILSIFMSSKHIFAPKKPLSNFTSLEFKEHTARQQLKSVFVLKGRALNHTIDSSQ